MEILDGCDWDFGGWEGCLFSESWDEAVVRSGLMWLCAHS